jgi:hypothetical protein
MTTVKGEQLHIPEVQAEAAEILVVTYDEQEQDAIAVPVEASPLTGTTTTTSQNQEQHHQDNDVGYDDGEFQCLVEVVLPVSLRLFSKLKFPCMLFYSSVLMYT